MRGLRALVVAALMATVVASCGQSGKPMLWQAFYFPGSAVIAVSTMGDPCMSDIAVTDESASAVEVTAHEATPLPGRGSCVSPIASTLFHLQGPVGTRRVGASEGSTGQVFNLATRLHQPITATTGMPWGAHSVSSPLGQVWTLAYSAPTGHLLYQLTSAPDDHRHQSSMRTIRGQPLVTPCPATLCWREGGLLYSISPLYGRPDPKFLTVGQASTLAIALQ